MACCCWTSEARGSTHFSPPKTSSCCSSRPSPVQSTMHTTQATDGGALLTMATFLTSCSSVSSCTPLPCTSIYDLRWHSDGKAYPMRSRGLAVATSRRRQDRGHSSQAQPWSVERVARYVRMCTCTEGRVQTQAARHPRTQRWLFSIVKRLCYVFAMFPKNLSAKRPIERARSRARRRPSPHCHSDGRLRPRTLVASGRTCP